MLACRQDHAVLPLQSLGSPTLHPLAYNVLLTSQATHHYTLCPPIFFNFHVPSCSLALSLEPLFLHPPFLFLYACLFLSPVSLSPAATLFIICPQDAPTNKPCPAFAPGDLMMMIIDEM